MASNYFLKLDHFEGPLDLLLYLIRKQELNIFTIDICVLSAQYLSYLREIDFEDLRDASEFIAMTAVLTEIKSKSLLPRNKRSGDEGSEEEDPAETLRRRLVEYSRFKLAGEYFAERNASLPLVAQPGYAVRQEEKHQGLSYPLLADPTTLLVLYEQMMSQLSDRKPNRLVAVTHQQTVEEMMQRVSAELKERRIMCLEDQFGELSSRYQLVAYVLAVLQLSREGQALVFQEEILAPLWICHSEHQHLWPPPHVSEQIPMRERSLEV